MASIKISELRPSDFDFLGDPESFLDDLSDNDLATINGGKGGIWGAIVSALSDFSVNIDIDINVNISVGR
jgi:hypothetical protein